MSQEEKDLIIKDICARLPYHVKVEITYSKENGSSLRQKICKEGVAELNSSILWLYEKNEINIKPYLFPMPNANEDEEFNKFLDELVEIELKVISEELECDSPFEYEMNYYHKNHIDYRYRGLIEKGFAIDATGKNIY